MRDKVKINMSKLPRKPAHETKKEDKKEIKKGKKEIKKSNKGPRKGENVQDI